MGASSSKAVTPTKDGSNAIPIPDVSSNPIGLKSDTAGESYDDTVMYLVDGTSAADITTVERMKKEEEEAKIAFKKYANINSHYITNVLDSKLKELNNKNNEKIIDEEQRQQEIRRLTSRNLIQHINDEDFDRIDHRQSVRIPPMVLKELKDAVDREAARRCYDLEKTMARCIQDKMWTAWKCQKDRDVYYACLRRNKNDNDLLVEMRWKYNLGTFHGEILARKAIMERLWKDHFPDREIPHEWANTE
eukprot:Tbor_TRINITY_DN5467_c6_g4::TRINITY_DN5467_c6_g4_i1::g.24721::m.24721